MHEFVRDCGAYVDYWGPDPGPNVLRIPSWENPGEYPIDLSHAQWRWEFLRRSREYIETWRQFQTDRQDPALIEKRPCRVPWYHLDRPINPCLRAEELSHKSVAYAGRTAVRHKPIPYQSSFDYDVFDDCPFGGDVEALLNDAAQWDALICVVRLYEPIDFQLDQIRSIYNDQITPMHRLLHKKLPKLHTSKFPLYLRVLDAQTRYSEDDEHVRASWSNVTARLASENLSFVVNSDSVRDTYDQATQIAEEICGRWYVDERSKQPGREE